jgi:hypothetical protein
MRLECTLVCAAALLACGKGAPEASRLDAGAEPYASAALTDAVILREARSVVIDELTGRLQGAWVTRDADYPGSRQAWEVHGGSVRVYDAGGKWEAEERFSVATPCSLVRTRSTGPGTETATADTFAFGDDGLHLVLAPAPGGLVRNDLITVCARNHVYSYDIRTKQCLRWDPTMTLASSSSREQCAITHGPVTEEFALRPLGGGASTHVVIQAGALLSPELAAHLAEPEPSWEAAVRRAEQLGQD